MKTAEEKAKEYAEKFNIYLEGMKVYPPIRDAFISGYNEGASSPKIKQLEWEDNFKETRWYCDLPIGFYIIDTVRKYEPYRVRFYLSEYDYPKYERYCKTIEEAMMYAQLDFEARIKECLTTE